MMTASGVGMAPPPLVSSAAVAIPKSLGPPPSTQMTQDDMADAFLRGSSSSSESTVVTNPLLRPLPLPTTETDLERIRVLVERRAWGDVLSMTSSLLKGATSHYAPIYNNLFLNPNHPSDAATLLNAQQLQEFVEILLLQGHAWMQMRRYKELATEVQQWSNCQYYLSSSDNNNKNQSSQQPPSWIPWAVHIFAAATLQYTRGDKELATTALWKIRAAIQQQLPGAPAVVLDLLHVEHTLFNVFSAQGEWRMALEALERMAPLLKDGADQVLLQQQQDQPTENDNAAQVWAHAAQCEIWSRQSRILLQVGALDGAQFLLEKANSLWQDVPHSHRSLEVLQSVPSAQRLLEQVEPQLSASLGLLQFAYKKYNLALENFRSALQIMDATRSTTAAHDAYSLTHGYLVTEWVGGGATLIHPVAKHTLYSEVTTNLAVAALYTCRLQEAVHVMESLIRRSPSEALTERSALNLCTLYELSGDAATATRKKRTLQLIAKRFFLHDIGPESFRL